MIHAYCTHDWHKELLTQMKDTTDSFKNLLVNVEHKLNKSSKVLSPRYSIPNV